MAYSTYLKYARALLAVAEEGGEEGRVEQELKGYQSLLREHAELSETLENPAIPFLPKRRIIEELAGRLGSSQTARNFLLVLLRNGRIADFDVAVTAMQEVLDQKRGIVRGEITSVQRLADDTCSRLEEAVERMMGSRVKLQFEQDPSLLGGIRLKIGSTIFDGSVETRLQSLKRKLATR